MTNISDLVANYVAVWNEPDADVRRRMIRSVWAPDGNTCYRLLDAHGYDAIEARVAGSWDKWLREGKYIFQPKSTVYHHSAVKLEFIMVTVPDGDVEANGLSFLILDPDGRIKHDFQFNPTANEASDLVDRYLAMWNESDPIIRRQQIAELWAHVGLLIRDTSVSEGHVAIEAEATKMRNAYVANGLVSSSAKNTHVHHNLVKLKWKATDSRDGAVSAAWSDLLMLDENGRIRFDFQFSEEIN